MAEEYTAALRGATTLTGIGEIVRSAARAVTGAGVPDIDFTVPGASTRRDLSVG